MAIHNTVMYENVNKAMAKQKVALEVSYKGCFKIFSEINKSIVAFWEGNQIHQ